MSDLDPRLARKAERLGRDGLFGKALGEKLGVTTAEANSLLAAGRALAKIDAAALTDSEIQLIRILASLRRAAIARGETRSVETRAVSRLLGKAPGWCAATARKRLFVERYDRLKDRTERGLGFVHISGNGFVWLTAAGWALAHALDERDA
ncbi:MAG: hypothetical protein DI527_18185 [Chelatococcus sp.]|nr:MAG: hypothetical protein DI527_18185 [Chelatococcus sp.]